MASGDWMISVATKGDRKCGAQGVFGHWLQRREVDVEVETGKVHCTRKQNPTQEQKQSVLLLFVCVSKSKHPPLHCKSAIYVYDSHSPINLLSTFTIRLVLTFKYALNRFKQANEIVGLLSTFLFTAYNFCALLDHFIYGKVQTRRLLHSV